MVIYKNRNKYDKSNAVVNNGLVVEYNRSFQSPDTVYIDCGLLVLNKKTLVFIPSGEFFQLDSVYSELIRRQELAAFEIKTRFYEIGSKSGLEDFKKLVERNCF